MNKKKDSSTLKDSQKTQMEAPQVPQVPQVPQAPAEVPQAPAEVPQAPAEVPQAPAEVPQKKKRKPLKLFRVVALDSSGVRVQQAEFASFRLAVGVQVHWKQLRPDYQVIVMAAEHNVYRIL